MQLLPTNSYLVWEPAFTMFLFTRKAHIRKMIQKHSKKLQVELRKACHWLKSEEWFIQTHDYTIVHWAYKYKQSVTSF